MSDNDTYDVIILGAGAAGLMCAATAGQRGYKVLIVDHADKVGKKILISGGGRCNFTNIYTAPNRFLSQNPHFVKSALSRFTAADFIAMVDSYGIAWHEKTLGQLFCDGSAREIVAMLLAECEKGAVKIALGHPAKKLRRIDDMYQMQVGSQSVSAPKLVVATGGPSIPKMGATGFAYDVARKFGVGLIEPRPALVPFTLSPEEQIFRSLSGVSTETIANVNDANFREAVLFTHKGLSGPAILQISSYWNEGEEIRLNLTPDNSQGWLCDAKKSRPKATLKGILSTTFPDRLATALAERIGLEGSLANVPDKTLTEIENRLADWRFIPNGTEGFAKAEVTVGGIDTAALSSKTCEVKNVPGLYFIGEAVDVTGWLGGYNFQWAWSSGWAAGQSI